MWPFENASSLLLAHWFDIHIDICCQLPMPLATAATSKCPTLLHLAHGDMVGGSRRSRPQSQGVKEKPWCNSLLHVQVAAPHVHET